MGIRFDNFNGERSDDLRAAVAMDDDFLSSRRGERHYSSSSSLSPSHPLFCSFRSFLGRVSSASVLDCGSGNHCTSRVAGFYMAAMPVGYVIAAGGGFAAWTTVTALDAATPSAQEAVM